MVYLQPSETVNDSIAKVVAAQAPYRIQIYDILNIRVKALDQDAVQIFNPMGEDLLDANSDERAYFDGFTVDLHGEIRVPALGRINVLGYTTEEIEKILEKKLLEEQFKETANIFVTVKLTGLRYTVSGEVEAPGTNTLFQDRVNIFEAIANAGEIPITGDRKDILIIRQYPQGQKIHHLDITREDVMSSPYYYIQPNDIIYVKPLPQKSWGTGETGVQTLTTIATILTLGTTTLLLIDRL
ncbi:polysaccharide biosynthesis/export family protein [Formosa algae]|uniref:Polysaccharide export outer membrane protein n=1 Tax=Formosa algae TaxID=225843 RepID=A0A9X0YQL4_9FLAO|nr:polysaccharide biosynthesis/export family protein [Formosa algae]MBP1841416.1 polysaccharide export outer membrane protein [Formosa algae]MDQ0336662.1 polysaccharide export outer membrane protein [Formosa algae]